MTFRTLLVASAAALSAAADVHAQIHTPNDHIPNFAASPTIRSAVNGSWSSPTTWTPARLPAASDIVSVAHAVTYDSTSGDALVIGIEAGGALRFAVDRSTKVRVGTLLVLQAACWKSVRRLPRCRRRSRPRWCSRTCR